MLLKKGHVYKKTKGIWIGEVLKEAMNVVEKKTRFLKRASK
jgi:hypothetical protein